MNKLDVFKIWVINEYSSTLPYYVNEGLIQENIPLKWIVEASLIVHRLSEMPWYTQEQILNETSLTKEELITLNSIIRESEFFLVFYFYQLYVVYVLLFVRTHPQ